MTITEEQAAAFARLIIDLVEPYIQEHAAEYAEFCEV